MEGDCDTDGELDWVSFLNRQEIIALINTLHQLSRSVEFSSSALRMREEGYDDAYIAKSLSKKEIRGEDDEAEDKVATWIGFFGL